MTPSDAAGLALLALRDRRLVAAILRHIRNAAIAEDAEALPPPLPGESPLRWGCRCRAPLDIARVSVEHDELLRAGGAQLACAARLGIAAVPLGHIRYPALLAAIADPPPLLWVRGTVEALSLPSVAIVGSRAATPYALRVARKLAVDLATAGVAIVSGLARGVDAAAHEGAVGANGRTVGVLGCGIDRIYPHEHGELASRMERAGAVASEFPPGVPPLPQHFPMRNRIISALSSAVVVVEAPEKSGALITASAAAEQGREVMVVPGPVSGGRNRGGHLLIRDGAKVVETADDILQELNWTNQGRLGSSIAGRLPETVEFTVDELAAETGELPNTVLARLLELELAGKIQRIGGGRFLRMLP